MFPTKYPFSLIEFFISFHTYSNLFFLQKDKAKLEIIKSALGNFISSKLLFKNLKFLFSSSVNLLLIIASVFSLSIDKTLNPII